LKAMPAKLLFRRKQSGSSRQEIARSNKHGNQLAFFSIIN
jgi:hypothetical protein